MKSAVIVGHDPASPGAYSNYLGMSEYLYNSEVAPYFAEIGADLFKRPQTGNYRKQMELLAEKINPGNYDLVLELHFNSYNRKAHGVEMITWKGNNYSLLIGERLCQAISSEYKTHNRGVKQRSQEGERGYWFLYYMEAAAIIVEPFFGDHEEAEKFKHPGKLAQVIKKTLCG